MANMIGTIVGGAMGTVGGIFSSIAGVKWDKKMTKMINEMPVYTPDKYTQNRYGMAQTLLNAKMPGAARMERNIYGSGANAMAAVNRGATDASQALAMAAGIQGQQGQQFDDLQAKDQQDYYNRYGIMNDASKGMTEQHDKIFDDQVRRWQDKVNIITAQYKARQAGGQSFTNMGGAAQSGLNSMGSMGGGSGGGQGWGSSLQAGLANSYQPSDKRLKHNYCVVGKSPSGINIYQFSYIGSDIRYEGVMADEVPQAAIEINGYLAVDYSKIDVQFKQL